MLCQLFLSSLAGLPVVVENFPGFRRLSVLRSRLCCLLFCQQGKSLRALSLLSVLNYQDLIFFFYSSGLAKQNGRKLIPLLFLLPQLDIVEFIPSLLYFGYTTLMVLSFWLLTGTIGFYAAYMFIRKIYAAVKID